MWSSTKVYNKIRGPGGGGAVKKLSMRDHNFSEHPLNKDFFMCQNDSALRDFSMIFFQNLTPKQSDKIREKVTVPYFLKMAVFDTLNRIPEFPFESKNNPYSVFFVMHAYSIILNCPPPPRIIGPWEPNIY